MVAFQKKGGVSDLGTDNLARPSLKDDLASPADEQAGKRDHHNHCNAREHDQEIAADLGIKPEQERVHRPHQKAMHEKNRKRVSSQGVYK